MAINTKSALQDLVEQMKESKMTYFPLCFSSKDFSMNGQYDKRKTTENLKDIILKYRLSRGQQTLLNKKIKSNLSKGTPNHKKGLHIAIVSSKDMKVVSVYRFDNKKTTLEGKSLLSLYDKELFSQRCTRAVPLASHEG